MAAVLSAQLLSAQQRDTLSGNFEEVVVTANKFEQKQGSTGKVVSVITQKDIAQAGGKTLTELLSGQAGMFLKGSGQPLGSVQSLFLQGASTGKTLVVIDGIPVFDASSPESSFDLNSIPLAQIERVEILRGSQSTHWGSDAIGGVVQIFLKKENRSPTYHIGYNRGSFGTNQFKLGTTGGQGKWGYGINYSHIRTHGFSSAFDSAGNKGFGDNGFEQNNVLASISYRLTPKDAFKVFGNYGKYNNALDAGAFKDEKDYSGTSENQLAALQYDRTGHRLGFHFKASSQKGKREYVNDSGYYTSADYSKYSRENYESKVNCLELNGDLKATESITLTGGAQYLEQKSTQSYLSISFDSNPNLSTLSEDSAQSNQISVYGSVNLIPLKGLSIEIGGRAVKHSKYGNNGTFSFNPSYWIDDATKVFVNVSSGFKAPSLYQLSYGESRTKNIRPELSNSYQVGFESHGANNKSTIRIVGFVRDVKSLITYYWDPINNKEYYMNIDKQHDYGVDIESSIGFGKIGGWKNNVSFVDGYKDTDTAFLDNLYQRPKFQLNSCLEIRPFKKLSLQPTFKYVGTRLNDNTYGGPKQLGDYYTLDVYIGYSLTKASNIFLDIRNITDQQYFEAPGYNSRRYNHSIGFNLQF